MYYLHQTNKSSIMPIPKTSAPFQYHRLAAVLLLGLLPTVSHSFIDERTKKPEQPASNPVAAPSAQATQLSARASGAPTIQVTETQIPAATLEPTPAIEVAPAKIDPVPVAPVATHEIPAPKAVPFQAGVMGDITAAIWSKPYPGPFGKMPLADALIAQVVPVVGGAISLAGSPMLLDRDVTLDKGLSRLNTITRMARANNLGIFIQGKTVSLAGPDTRSETAAVPGAGVVITPVAKDTKAWNIEVGTMLSTAVLDWAQKWGWTLIWKADVDYRMVAPINIEANFLDGVAKVLDAYRGGDRPLWGDWQSEQKILVIREPNSRDRP